MKMLKTYEMITQRDTVTGEPLIKGHYFPVVDYCYNDFGGDLSTIPAGSLVMVNFVGDFGMYGMTEVAGVLHKVKVPLNQLHKIDFSGFTGT